MTDLGRLNIEAVYDLQGRPLDWRFEWEGGKRTRISYPFVAAVRPRLADGDWVEGGKVHIGPVWFRIVGSDYSHMFFAAERLTPVWFIKVWNWGIWRKLRKLYRTVIFTLSLWHLAHVPAGETPGIRHIGRHI